MRIISDIEIHSHYSRACSPELTPENIAKWAAIKGVNLIGTGDFTHPKWRTELREGLEEAEEGFYRLKRANGNMETSVRFILSAEVSCIYSQGGKLRRVHHILVAPSFDTVAKFVKSLEGRGAKLASDGRPILGMDSQEVLKYLLDASPDAMLIPAHVWTPYFGLFGSKSGFDSVEECFGDMTRHIHAFETGLSSDPSMNWRISANDRFTLISSSDAHSLPRIGREANVMEIPDKEFNYMEFTRIIREKDRERFKYTIEYFPEEGKYHMDGHAACKFSCEPHETRKLKGQCPKCGKKLTVGVMSRIEDLADRPLRYESKNLIGQKHLVPLEEVLADCLGQGVKTKRVQELYWKLIERAGTEFAVILDMEIKAIEEIAGEMVAEAVRRVREEKVEKVAGYDGVYGIMKIFTDTEREGLIEKQQGKQDPLF